MEYLNAVPLKSLSMGAFLSFCQNWPARPVSLQRKCNNFKEHLHDNSSHCSGGVYIIFQACYIEGVVELFLPNARCGRSVLSNGKRPKSAHDAD